MKFINTPYNYTGSKFNLLEQIVPLFDYSKKYFVDLFTGSFVVAANVVDKYERVLANDIIGDLIGIHKNMINNTDEFIEKVKNLSVPCKASQEEYNKLRESYNNEKTPEKLYALMLSCTNNMIRYNKSMNVNQTWGKRCFNDNTQKKIDEFVKYIQPYKDKIYFSSRNFNEINIFKPSMIYCDPPYSNSESGYNNIWSEHDDLKLYLYCKELDKLGSSFMVSGVLSHDGESCVLLDNLKSDGYKITELNFDYNKVSRKGKKETTEVVITNY